MKEVKFYCEPITVRNIGKSGKETRERLYILRIKHTLYRREVQKKIAPARNVEDIKRFIKEDFEEYELIRLQNMEELLNNLGRENFWRVGRLIREHNLNTRKGNGDIWDKVKFIYLGE